VKDVLEGGDQRVVTELRQKRRVVIERQARDAGNLHLETSRAGIVVVVHSTAKVIDTLLLIDEPPNAPLAFVVPDS
jgi:hypothetical protein